MNAISLTVFISGLKHSATAGSLSYAGIGRHKAAVTGEGCESCHTGAPELTRHSGAGKEGLGGRCGQEEHGS